MSQGFLSRERIFSGIHQSLNGENELPIAAGSFQDAHGDFSQLRMIGKCPSRRHNASIRKNGFGLEEGRLVASGRLPHPCLSCGITPPDQRESANGLLAIRIECPASKPRDQSPLQSDIVSMEIDWLQAFVIRLDLLLWSRRSHSKLPAVQIARQASQLDSGLAYAPIEKLRPSARSKT